ncbi:hypothetical protein CcCBS67573_g02636 [Chytriomyces confervae]|uniref:Uncharacterized protein n=1 Tax=Chytriomyces confervae TaxID=246404 RepID=A0A507FIF3_9FUNG|nr:hypothetical protein HDU80_006094 [Chytriomyces hyalinus]TPX76084.1 hypothetical protein CcCBS67573_g02636 [Chytriomyces confervae]
MSRPSTYIEPDGSTPPMFLNPAVNTLENKATIALTVSVFVSVFPVFYFFQVFVVRWFLGQEKWSQSVMQAAESVEVIATNYRLVLHHLFAYPTRKEMRANPVSLLPFVFLLGLVISFGVIEDAIDNKMPITSPTPFLINRTQAQGGMILFFISCNGFLIARLNEHYRDKTEMRKKAAAHAFRVTYQAAFTAKTGPALLEGEYPESHDGNDDPETPEEVVPAGAAAAAQPHTEHTIFNKEFEFIRRLKHILPQYNKVSINFGNIVQIVVLAVELVQLASFPYRDLLMNQQFQASLTYQWNTGTTDDLGNSVVTGLRHMLTSISSGLPNIDTLVLSNIQFAIAWWISLIGATLAAVAVLIRSNLKSDFFQARPKLKKAMSAVVSGSYIVYFEPITSMLYLVMLGSFVEPLGCLSNSDIPLWPPAAGSNSQEAAINLMRAVRLRQEQCSPILLNPPLHVWCTLSGYMLGYYVLTIFKICDEQKPREGIVTFTTRSEVLNKNGSLILLLLHTLIPTEDSTTLRGSIGIIVLLIMIFYQVRIGSSYIRPINFWRSVSFCWVLWMSICTMYFTHPNTRGFYGIYPDPPINYRPWMRIALAVGIGWIVILVLYSITYLIFIRKMEKDSTKPRIGISYNYNAKDDEDGRLTQIIHRAMHSDPMNRIRQALHISIPAKDPAPPPVSSALAVIQDSNSPQPSVASNFGTIKSIESGRSVETLASAAPSHLSSSRSHSTDRSGVYNSNLRVKISGPRALLDSSGNEIVAKRLESEGPPQEMRNSSTFQSDSMRGRSSSRGSLTEISITGGRDSLKVDAVGKQTAQISPETVGAMISKRPAGPRILAHAPVPALQAVTEVITPKEIAPETPQPIVGNDDQALQAVEHQVSIAVVEPAILAIDDIQGNKLKEPPRPDSSDASAERESASSVSISSAGVDDSTTKQSVLPSHSHTEDIHDEYSLAEEVSTKLKQALPEDAETDQVEPTPKNAPKFKAKAPKGGKPVAASTRTLKISNGSGTMNDVRRQMQTPANSPSSESPYKSEGDSSSSTPKASRKHPQKKKK